MLSIVLPWGRIMIDGPADLSDNRSLPEIPMP
jgi:hypothetical protein